MTKCCHSMPLSCSFFMHKMGRSMPPAGSWGGLSDYWPSVRAITLSLQAPCHSPESQHWAHGLCLQPMSSLSSSQSSPGNTSMSAFVHVSLLPLCPHLTLHPSFHFRPISHNYRPSLRPKGLLERTAPCFRSGRAFA